MNKTALEKFKRVMQHVYGEYNAKQLPWKPKPFQGHARYLWTDAFGVCNFITLFAETKDAKYLDQADALIQSVHDTLGKDRTLKHRLGNATAEQPLLGGLRIGKEDDEGASDGDGQYFHYLTKWAYCLNRMSIARKQSKYNDWAVQLLQSTHKAFVKHRDSMRPRMVWKVSIDLQRPLVMSEGNLDPFDGYVTYRLVQSHSNNPTILQEEIQDLEKIVMQKYKMYASTDTLDLGEALWLCHFYNDEEWSKTVTAASLRELDLLYKKGHFASKKMRLAFREFGTCLGLQVNDQTNAMWKQRAQELTNYWESTNLYARDEDITPVMYCASLIPGCFTVDYHIA